MLGTGCRREVHAKKEKEAALHLEAAVTSREARDALWPVSENMGPVTITS